MDSNLWKDDPALLNEVTQAVMKVSREIFFDTDWIKSEIEDHFNWDDKEARAENIREITEKARRVSKGRAEKKTIYEPKDYVAGGLDQSYATMREMQEPIEALRLKYWGTTEPPFRRSVEGDRETAEWFYSQEQKDAAAHPDGLPGVATVTYTLSAKNAAAADEINDRLHEKYADGDGYVYMTATRCLEMAKALVEDAENNDNLSFERIRTSGFFQSERIDLHGIVSAGGGVSVAAVAGETLGDLLKDVRELAKSSGWWSEDNAFWALLYGSIIPAGVRRTSNLSWFNGEHRRKITLTVIAPTTFEEVAKAYAKELERLKLNPKPLTKQQSALMQLWYQHPSTTWAERYEVWQRWCEIHYELKDYNNWRSLRSSCKSALARARHGWGEKVRESSP